jgi:hypothetical protein
MKIKFKTEKCRLRYFGALMYCPFRINTLSGPDLQTLETKDLKVHLSQLWHLSLIAININLCRYSQSGKTR